MNISEDLVEWMPESINNVVNILINGVDLYDLTVNTVAKNIKMIIKTVNEFSEFRITDEEVDSNVVAYVYCTLAHMYHKLNESEVRAYFNDIDNIDELISITRIPDPHTYSDHGPLLEKLIEIANAYVMITLETTKRDFECTFEDLDLDPKQNLVFKIQLCNILDELLDRYELNYNLVLFVRKQYTLSARLSPKVSRPISMI